jgi:hypothetical protein
VIGSAPRLAATFRKKIREKAALVNRIGVSLLSDGWLVSSPRPPPASTGRFDVRVHGRLMEMKCRVYTAKLDVTLMRGAVAVN